MSAFKQDLPPSGGYQSITWWRTFPRKWINAKKLFLGTAVFMVYAQWQWYAWMKRKNTVALAGHDARISIEPFLLAERDRNYLKMLRKNLEKEREVMRDVPGWVPGTWYGEPVYYTLGDKWFDSVRDEIFVHMPHRSVKRDSYFSEHPEYTAPQPYHKYLPKWMDDYFF